MRKLKPKKRYLPLDPKFNDALVTRFVNMMMYEGKKSITFGIFYDAIDLVETPGVEVKSRRIGGANFQIPTEIRPDRKISLSMKWLIMFARKRSGKSMAEKLAAEVVAAAKGEGATIKKKEDVHKMAEANKAFAHFKS